MGSVAECPNSYRARPTTPIPKRNIVEVSGIGDPVTC